MNANSRSRDFRSVWSDLLTVLLLLPLLFNIPRAAAQTDSFWTNSAGGAWSVGANWSTNPAYPDNSGGSTYRAIIDLPGPAYNVDLAAPIVVSAFGMNSGSATVRHTAGVLEVLGLADLASGVFRLDGGTLRGGTWNPEPGTLTIANNANNRLEQVALTNDLYLGVSGAQVRIADGITLGGTLTVAGSNALIAFTNTQTVSGGRIAFPSVSGSYRMEVYAGQVLTVSPTTEILGGEGYIFGGGTLQNLGTIRGNVSGRQLSVSTNGFLNSGFVRCENGATLVIGTLSGAWSNETTGTLRVESGTLRLDGAWSNQGLIELAGGTLRLDGTFTTAAMGNIARTGGTILIQGDVDNTSASLDIDAASDSIHLSSATIVGGEINAADGKSLIIDSGRSTLDGVIVNAPVVFSGSSSSILLRNGAAITQPVTIVNSGAAIYVGAGMTLDDVSFWLNSTSSSSPPRIALEGEGLVTFGPNFELRGGYGSVTSDALTVLLNQGRVFADSRDLTVSARTFENQGLMEAIGSGRLFVGASTSTWTNAAGGTLNVGSGARLDTAGAWQNNGAIVVNAGSLVLGGSFSLEPGGTIQRTDGTVTLIGSLQNAGRTLTLDATSGPWIFSNDGFGTGHGVVGGTLNIADPQYAFFGNLGGVFEGVTVNGPVIVQSPSSFTQAQLNLRNGTRFNDGVTVPQWGVLGVPAPQTLDNSTIHLTGGELYMSGAGQVTFGPALFVHGTRSVQRYGTLGGSFVNQGTIVADQSGATLQVNHENMRNEGILRATNGAALHVAIGPESPSLFVNAPGGRVEATGGTVRIGSNSYTGQLWRNEGELVVTNSLLDMHGTHTPGDFGQITRSGGEIWLSGLLNNEGSVWDFASGSGPWRMMNQGAVQGGVVNISEATFDARSEGNFDGSLLIGDIAIDAGAVNFRFGAQIRGRIRMRGEGVLTLDCSTWTEPTELLFEGDATVTRGGWTPDFIIPASMLAHGSCGVNGLGFEVWGNERITNRGTIAADLGDIHFSCFQSEGFEFYNLGTVRAQNAKRVQFGFITRFPNITADGRLTGGRWEVFGTSRIEINGFPHINEAQVLLSGPNAYFAPVVGMDHNRGEFALANNKQFFVEPDFLNEGILRVGRGCSMNVIANYTQTGTALLECTLASGGAHGRLLVDGTIQVAGTLSAVLGSGFVPQLGDEFAVITAQTGLTGAFGNQNLPALAEGLQWSVVQTANSVTLRVDAAPSPCPGDLNGDRSVDISDLAVLLAHFGSTSGATPADGDLDGDQAVTLSDLAILLSHFGTICP